MDERWGSGHSAQRFLKIHAATYNHFNYQRQLINRPHVKKLRADALVSWKAAAIAS